MDRHPLTSPAWIYVSQKSGAVSQISGNVGNAGNERRFLACMLRFCLPHSIPGYVSSSSRWGRQLVDTALSVPRPFPAFPTFPAFPFPTGKEGG